MQIIVHAHGGKWYIGVLKDSQRSQPFTGSKQRSQSSTPKKYELWTGAKWGKQYSAAQAFESEESAQKYVEENREALEAKPGS